MRCALVSALLALRENPLSVLRAYEGCTRRVRFDVAFWGPLGFDGNDTYFYTAFTRAQPGVAVLFEIAVFGFGLLVDGDVGIGVLP